MSRTELRTIVQMFAFIAVCTIFLVSCAGPTMQSEPAASPPPESPVRSDDGAYSGLEEVVVTGTRVEAKERRTSSRAMRERSVAGTANAQRPVTSIADHEGSLEAAVTQLSSDEELWVIATPTVADNAAATNDDSPGSGAMLASFPGDIDPQTGVAREIPLPLQHTAVQAKIDGYLSSVNVRQQFANPFDEKIEAVYLFPLPEKAAVSEFLMIIGERKIRGILREKEQAEAIYEAAKSQGYQASLLVQHRPNVFEQKVANIEPGKSIDVDIKYFHTLAYNDGWYSFVLPTVVGPRYNPPGSKDPLVPVPQGARVDSTETTIPYLRPGQRSAHDISIDVEIDAGVAIETLQSTHQIASTRPAPEIARVRLANQSTIPNRDFVLNFKVAGDTIKSNLMTWRDPDSGQGYFTMMLYPPAETARLERQAMELVFVLDCSGSMHGRPLEQAKSAVSAALNHLQPGDTFQIIRFSENSTQLGATPLPATTENLRRGRQYLASLNSTGGTQMIEGVKAALDFPHDPTRLRFVTFMTDGYIGNETDIIGAVHERIGAARIFSFGVGSAVNRYLLERMAKEGRGAVAYLGAQDSASKIMDGFFQRISHPALTDIRIDWGGMLVSDVYPARIPDMFVGRAVLVSGRYTGTPGEISVSGNAGAEQRSINVATDTGDDTRAAVAKLWARLRIADLADRQSWENDPYDELAGAIKATALQHKLVSAYTSFVAVDTSRQTEGDSGVTVPQALPVPDGVRYDTTVRQD